MFCEHDGMIHSWGNREDKKLVSSFLGWLSGYVRVRDPRLRHTAWIGIHRVSFS